MCDEAVAFVKPVFVVGVVEVKLPEVLGVQSLVLCFGFQGLGYLAIRGDTIGEDRFPPVTRITL
jgi:hypothetical protein